MVRIDSSVAASSPSPPSHTPQEVCAALNAVCRLTTMDTIPAVLPQVANQLKHEV